MKFSNNDKQVQKQKRAQRKAIPPTLKVYPSNFGGSDVQKSDFLLDSFFDKYEVSFPVSFD